MEINQIGDLSSLILSILPGKLSLSSKAAHSATKDAIPYLNGGSWQDPVNELKSGAGSSMAGGGTSIKADWQWESVKQPSSQYHSSSHISSNPASYDGSHGTSLTPYNPFIPTLLSSSSTPAPHIPASSNTITSVLECCSLDASGRYLACTSLNGTLLMLFEDFASVKCIEFEGDSIVCVEFLNLLLGGGSKQSAALVTGSKSGTIRIYDPVQGQLILANCFTDSKVVSMSTRMAKAENEYDKLSILYENGTLVVIDANSIWMNVKMMIAEGGLFSFDPIPMIHKSFKLEPSKRADFSSPSFLDCQLVGMGEWTRFSHLEFNTLTSEPIEPVDSAKACEFAILGTPLLQLFRVDLYKDDQVSASSAAESVVKNVFSIGLNLWENPKQLSLGKLIEIPKLKAFSIFDEATRNARFSLASPDWYHTRLILIADTLGRLLLYSQPHDALIHVWKGMRNVEIGWLDSPFDNTLLLLTYHPRGQIEIFAIPGYTRIAVGPAEKNGRLVQSVGGMVGAIHLKKKRFHSVSCILLLPDARVCKIELSVEAAALAKPDQFESFCQAVKTANYSAVKKILQSYQFASLRLKALSLLTSEVSIGTYRDFLVDCISATGPEAKEMQSFECQIYFLESYRSISQLSSGTPKHTFSPDSSSSMHLKWLNEIHIVSGGKNDFLKIEDFDYIKFLSCFQPCFAGDVNLIETNKFCVSQSLSDHMRYLLASVLIYPIVVLDANVESIVNDLLISGKDWLNLLTCFIKLSSSTLSADVMRRLAKLLYYILDRGSIEFPTSLFVSLYQFAYNLEKPLYSQMCCLCLKSLLLSKPDREEIKHPDLDNQRLLDLSTQLLDKIHRVLPFSLLLPEIPLVASQYNRTEIYSTAYLVAGHLESIGKHWDVPLFNRMQSVGVAVKKSIVQMYLVFNAYKNYDLNGRDEDLQSLIGAVDSFVIECQSSEPILTVLVCCTLERLFAPRLCEIVAMFDRLCQLPKEGVHLSILKCSISSTLSFLQLCTSISTTILSVIQSSPIESRIEVHSYIEQNVTLGEIESRNLNNALGNMLYVLPKTIVLTYSSRKERSALVHVLACAYKYPKLGLVVPSNLFEESFLEEAIAYNYSTMAILSRGGGSGSTDLTGVIGGALSALNFVDTSSNANSGGGHNRRTGRGGDLEHERMSIVARLGKLGAQSQADALFIGSLFDS